MIAKTAIRGFLTKQGARPQVLNRPQVVRHQLSKNYNRAYTVKTQAIKEGASAASLPTFASDLEAHDGSKVNLSKIGKTVVLFFYPKAGTPGCTKQTETFASRYSEFTDAGAEVFGISSDPSAAQKSFAGSTGAQFLLLTDDGDKLRNELGVKADFLGMLKGRQTFVFDAEGKCVLSFNSQLDIQGHIDKALAAVKSI